MTTHGTQRIAEHLDAADRALAQLIATVNKELGFLPEQDESRVLSDLRHAASLTRSCIHELRQATLRKELHLER